MAEKQTRKQIVLRVIEIVAAFAAGLVTVLMTGCSSMGDVQWNGRILRHPESAFTKDLNQAAENAVKQPEASVTIPHAK